MERKIGEIFEYNGEWYQCINTGNCSECAFTGKRCYDFSTKGVDIIGDCTGRTFKKLEKVGEPYMDGGKIMQKYKRVYREPIYFPYKELNCYNDLHGRICIEIKQTNKDMEENKLKISFEKADYLINKLQDILADYLHGGESDEVIAKFEELLDIEEKHSNSESIGKNLMPFDLEAAKAGKPVCTRDGRKARIICFDIKDKDNPIAAAVYVGECESVYLFTNKGEYNKGREDELDLMMLPEKKEGWVNVYREESNNNERLIEQTIYKTRKDAFEHACPQGYITTTKINWEE